MLDNITAGNPRILIKPALYTTMANVAGMLPFALMVEAARLIFEPFAYPGEPLNTNRLWLVCGALALAMIVSYAFERPAYRSQFRGAYSAAATGRSRLAEHLRRLPLGLLNKRDPGDLAGMMMGDITLLEHGISHLVPQMIGGLVLPIMAMIGLAFVDWRMSLALFAALPVVIALVLFTSGVQRKLGRSHIRAKLNAANRMQEYLSGLRVIKAYNLTGERFVRLERSFHELMRHSIRIEGWLGPIVLIAIACVRAGLTLMILAGVHLLLGGSLGLTEFVVFLIVGTRVFDPLSAALVGYAEFRYQEQAGERIIRLLQEPVMSGEE